MMSGLVDLLEKVRETVYRGPIKRAVVAMGLEPRLKTAYSALLSTASNDETVTHDVAGVEATFRVSTGMEVQRFRGLMNEQGVVKSILSDITEEDVFYDVGANVGLYTCFVSQVSESTVAFEPHPENADRLRENLVLNDIGNIEVREEALSHTNGDAELAVTGADVAGEGTHALATGSEEKTVGIRTIRADSLSPEVPNPDVVKIDVEGAEISVLRGMGDLLDSCRLVYCETHPERLEERGESHDEVVKLLTGSGFSVEEIESRGEETFLRAVK